MKEHPLGDAPDLDVSMLGGHLPSNGRSILVGGVVEVLLAVTSAQGLHGAHPKVVPVGANDLDGLAEAQLDFEPVAVELDDLERCQGEVRGEEENGSADWVVDQDKTNATAC